MIYDCNNETHEKYIQAMKSLDDHNMVSEYRKVPDTKEEIAFASETNHARTSQMFGLNISEDRYKAIFTKKDAIDDIIDDIYEDMFE